MTRRERIEARLARRLEWRASRLAQSKARFDNARQLADSIPLGQPILVGHHSEARARRDAERIHDNMSAAVESAKMAERHSQVADTLARALDASIFSDDSDAAEALEARIAAREAERERMKRVNALYRKGSAAGLAELGLDLEAMRARLNAPDVMSWCRVPYELQNLGGRIAADRKRLAVIRAQQQRQQTAAASGGVTVESSGEWCRVTFAEKPAREVLDALRSAGFRWSGGSWSGPVAKLPAGVTQ